MLMIFNQHLTLISISLSDGYFLGLSKIVTVAGRTIRLQSIMFVAIYRGISDEGYFIVILFSFATVVAFFTSSFHYGAFGYLHGSVSARFEGTGCYCSGLRSCIGTCKYPGGRSKKASE